MGQTSTELLEALEAKLAEDLAAVRKLLGKEDVKDHPVRNNGHSVKIKPKPEGTPKGDMTWEKYVVEILGLIGGEGKANDVIEYAIKANPKEAQKTVEDAVGGKLSKLSIAGLIHSAPVSKAKKDGNIYSLLDRHPK